ncbi:Uncharacterised protein [Mycobacteroides abscessus subsp. abscessus]|nr:Uncharacterised protein [Mycobacteroides abscessus subsp. abscessus]
MEVCEKKLEELFSFAPLPSSFVNLLIAQPYTELPERFHFEGESRVGMKVAKIHFF